MRLSRSMACPQRLALLLVLAAAVACDASAARLLPPGGGGARTPAAVSSRTLQTEQAPFAAAQAERVDSVHQPLRSTPRTWTALALSLVVAALSNAAGVGGGAIFVLLFVALLDLPVKEATALSQAVITGGALGSVAYCISRRHPRNSSRPLIDFDLALTLTPSRGVNAGVLLNAALPSW
jgi:hypothetical protein